MNGPAPVTFNVIFVRRTVRLLRIFLHSLRSRTTVARFRLVANGCTRAETRWLREYCDSHDRFEFLNLSPTAVLRHSAVLNKLVRLERSPVFAFMDSDCFVTGDPFTHVRSTLNGHGAVFSGQPKWRAHQSSRLPLGFRELSDAYRETPQGQCVGCSYFAVYDRRALSSCMDETGVLFDEYFWDDLPVPVQAELARADLQLAWYDTGKVLNILLGLRGHHLEYVDLPHLWHVGAVSASVTSRGPLQQLRHSLGSVGAFHVTRQTLVRLGLLHPFPCLGMEERRAKSEYSRRREAVSHYIAALLHSLDSGEPARVRFDHPDAALVSAISAMEGHVRELSRDWSSARRTLHESARAILT